MIEDKSPLSSGFRIIDEPMYSAHSGRQLLSLFFFRQHRAGGICILYVGRGSA
ncbi:hypothetical protein IE987_25770 [Klebsiella pneumoniae]|uniref:Uncharacterized protein n=1 Tax=Klebsiella pneumoniae TaxID=573 RepID=A0A927DJT5_KLEPN|nr:hypothetical protein [Klebsiella pneumoniae]